MTTLQPICQRCGDEDGPYTLDGLCEDCERLVPAEND
jgi:NMD protein affecting ribosome stability and mRNA decay